jgi:hypothetical protein
MTVITSGIPNASALRMLDGVIVTAPTVITGVPNVSALAIDAG